MKQIPANLSELDDAEFEKIHAAEIRKLRRLERRLESLRQLAAEEERAKSLNEIGEIIGLSEERVRQIQNIAIAKIRRNHPELRDLLDRTTD
jgi:DNA-directed RNA polymerase sigma subunit (sigma70/sigma32)